MFDFYYLQDTGSADIPLGLRVKWRQHSLRQQAASLLFFKESLPIMHCFFFPSCKYFWDPTIWQTSLKTFGMNQWTEQKKISALSDFASPGELRPSNSNVINRQMLYVTRRCKCCEELEPRSARGAGQKCACNFKRKWDLKGVKEFTTKLPRTEESPWRECPLYSAGKGTDVTVCVTFKELQGQCC